MNSFCILRKRSPPDNQGPSFRLPCFALSGISATCHLWLLSIGWFTVHLFWGISILGEVKVWVVSWCKNLFPRATVRFGINHFSSVCISPRGNGEVVAGKGEQSKSLDQIWDPKVFHSAGNSLCGGFGYFRVLSGTLDTGTKSYFSILLKLGECFIGQLSAICR